MTQKLAESIHVLGAAGTPVITLDQNSMVKIGANGGEGYLAIYSKDATRSDPNRAPSFVMEAETGRFWVGTKNLPGEILMFPAESDQGNPDKASVNLSAQEAELRMGGAGRAGQIRLFASGGTRSKPATASIHLDGDAGDIVLRNGDAAEEFDVDEAHAVSPGTVVVIGEDGKLRPCSQSYDKRVAGIIAGAESSRPGIVLGRTDTRPGRLPVALIGRVFCRADASFGAIELGDLLTTSSNPGHAMKASDGTRAFGAVIGKAMGTLPAGQGLVPVLVSLQ
jgi:hypothetical protein